MDPNMLSSSAEFSGSVSREDFSRIQTLLMPWWMRWYVFVPCVIYLFVSLGTGWTTAFSNSSGAAPDLGLAGLVLVAMAAITTYGRARNWRNITALTGCVHGAATVSGIEWNTDNASARYTWEKLVKVQRATDLTLVYYAPRCAFYFPRAFFESDDSWQQFNEILKTKISGRARL